MQVNYKHPKDIAGVSFNNQTSKKKSMRNTGYYSTLRYSLFTSTEKIFRDG
jgi:hypothetical protein